MSELAPPVPLPAGRPIQLAGRGRTFVREAAGPPGAPTVLLLHGWTVTSDLNWFACYGPLAESYRVIAMDHRGHGQGIRSWRPFRLEDCADDAAAVLRELDAGPVIAIGYSMGGAVAQLLWRRHPELVSGLVLCATACRFLRPDPRTQLYWGSMLGLSVAARITPQPVRQQLADTLIRRRLHGSALADWAMEEMRRCEHAAVFEAGWAIGRFRSEPWIGEVDVPTAVVVTALDQVVEPRRQRELAAAVPHALRIEVEGDHAACAADPDRFVPALLDACRAVSST
ncbi:MAG TPA: alpha/beta hydrolase [Acidimicrobiales bacterium]|nr:alpha/beta hydrolase [Acidimicrobiales bacterium]